MTLTYVEVVLGTRYTKTLTYVEVVLGTGNTMCCLFPDI